jgi:hypothetical protein
MMRSISAYVTLNQKSTGSVAIDRRRGHPGGHVPLPRRCVHRPARTAEARNTTIAVEEPELEPEPARGNLMPLLLSEFSRHQQRLECFGMLSAVHAVAHARPPILQGPVTRSEPDAVEQGFHLR